MHKRNVYIILTVFCLSAIIAIQSIITAKTLPEPEVNFTIDQLALLKSPRLVPASFLLILYAGLIVTGIIMLIIAIAKRCQSRTAIAQRETHKALPLTETQSSKLFFLASFLLLTLELTIVFISMTNIKMNPMGILLVANGLMELGTIILVIVFLSTRWLDFKIKKNDLVTIFGIYTAALPLLIVAALLSTLVAQKLGAARTINPAVTLLLALKNKTLITILTFEATILGPIAEELFFRGFIYKFARTRFSFLPAAIATSFFFATLHRTPQDILPLSVISIALCYAYEKTQNIISPVIFHAFYNSLNLALLFLLKDFIKI